MTALLLFVLLVKKGLVSFFDLSPSLCRPRQSRDLISAPLGCRTPENANVAALSLRAGCVFTTSRTGSWGPFHSNEPSRAPLFCTHTSRRTLRSPRCNPICSYSTPPPLPDSPELG